MANPAITPAQLEPIQHALRAGRQIEAIKLYRAATGADLAAATSAVEAMAAQTPQASPFARSSIIGGVVVALLLALCSGGAWLAYRWHTSKDAESSAAANVVASSSASKSGTLSGKWVLQNNQRQFNVTFASAGQGEYRMTPRNLAYSGTYSSDAAELKRVRAEGNNNRPNRGNNGRNNGGNGGDQNFTWHWLDADHLVLINTQYRGSMLTREGALPYKIPETSGKAASLTAPRPATPTPPPPTTPPAPKAAVSPSSRPSTRPSTRPTATLASVTLASIGHENVLFR